MIIFKRYLIEFTFFFSWFINLIYNPYIHLMLFKSNKYLLFWVPGLSPLFVFSGTGCLFVFDCTSTKISFHSYWYILFFYLLCFSFVQCFRYRKGTITTAYTWFCFCKIVYLYSFYLTKQATCLSRVFFFQNKKMNKGLNE